MVCGLIGLTTLLGPLGWVTVATAATITAGAVTSTAIMNTIACGLLIGSNNWSDSVDRDQLQDKVNEIVYHWLDQTTNWAQNITSILFGAKDPGKADVWDFLGKVRHGVADGKAERKEGEPDWHALVYLMEDGAFLDSAGTKEYVNGLMDFGLQTMVR